MRLRFLGAAGTVTGSRYLLDAGSSRLLVDCGLFQGLKNLRLRNWDRFPVPPETITSVVLSHAHIDHSGYLPRLAKLGFRGKVHCTSATSELCRVLLPDAGRLQEEEAEYANRKGFSKHKPALPLYTEEEARESLRLLQVEPFDQSFDAMAGVRARFTRAGHILGAASVHLEWSAGSILFSGDLGRSNDVLMRPPQPPPAADTVVVESTYGDRVHEKADPFERVAEAVNRTVARKGVVVIPAFAVGRAQTLLYMIHVLKSSRRIPDIPVYLNSPMAASVTGILQRHPGDHRLTDADAEAVGSVARIVNTVEESIALNRRHGPMIIVSASGMATGGRVVHHLKAFAPDPRNLIMLAGFQAAGTRGASLERGATEIKIHGGYVPVRAEVLNIDLLSAHADREELASWLASLPRPPRQVFVTHGEPSSADAFRRRIEERFGWPARVPDLLDEVELGTRP